VTPGAQVRKEGDAEKYEAQVLVVAHQVPAPPPPPPPTHSTGNGSAIAADGFQVDLALLTVKKAAFWLDAMQLDLGPSPRLQQEVHVIGYPLGGEGISITAGVVSRVDFGE
jgi:hypothetical protein